MYTFEIEKGYFYSKKCSLRPYKHKDFPFERRGC